MATDSDTGGGGRMTVICAWCGTVLQSGEPEPVSHGLCDDCLPLFVEAVEERLAEGTNQSDPSDGDDGTGIG